MNSVTRRLFLCGSASLMTGAETLTPAVSAVDHLLLGISDLERGIEWVAQRTGIRPVAGGSHPGVGTRNALLSLGAGHYLEIIAPDPEQSRYNFHIDVRQLTEPRLITFAASTSDIETTAANARKAGYQIFGPSAGSRQVPLGKQLRWRSLGVLNTLGSGGIEPVPFFIQWDRESPHPSQSAPAGCELESLAFEHPNQSALAAAFRTLGIDGKVSQAGAVRILATLKTAKGRVELS
jgi:glyoxalase-like protein